LALGVRDQDKEERPLRSSVGQLSTLQQRFEDSRAGKVVISVLVAVIMVVGVVWNIPDSPIRNALKPVVEPVAAPVGLDQYWAMYATPSKRVEAVEVEVKMANGETRVWHMQPGERGMGWWDRWIMLRRAVMYDASVRPQVARWVVREVTAPTERAVAVAIVLRVENLSPPGEKDAAGGKSAMKILYQEALAGRP
jgi:hypothetical protein